ncbi:hypothetical protein [Acinetobacter sp.]|nr:hypothetical protein [Acinetobacter sp.]
MDLKINDQPDKNIYLGEKLRGQEKLERIPVIFKQNHYFEFYS